MIIVRVEASQKSGAVDAPRFLSIIDELFDSLHFVFCIHWTLSESNSGGRLAISRKHCNFEWTDRITVPNKSPQRVLVNHVRRVGERSANPDLGKVDKLLGSQILVAEPAFGSSDFLKSTGLSAEPEHWCWEPAIGMIRHKPNEMTQPALGGLWVV